MRIKRVIDQERTDIKELMEIIEKEERYISNFSHRIRTPLNNLPLINDLLSEMKVDKEQKELLDTLILSTNNMISALNELTMRSAGEVSIKPRKNIRFNLEQTVDNTIELLGVEEPGELRLDVSWDNRIKKEYIGDPIAIKQIFIDIFSTWSTLPESEKPNVNIYVKLKARHEQTDSVDFIIETESSPGSKYISLDKEEIEKSLSNKIISLMGGQYLYKTLGNHALFNFTLPLKNVIEEETAVDEKIKKLDIVSGQKKKLSDARVLLVEDNISNQRIVTISLGSKVKSIDTATNGKEALDMFVKSDYDIILMDIRLPVLDGIEASKKIREMESGTNRYTPIIALTANAMIGDKEQCIEAGMDDYLSKPFQPQKLLDMLNKYVTGPEHA
ncbi:MAG: response regulator [Bacteroidales bacterium]|nr:response regulator [Bacteroidales bacterium]